MEGSLRRRGKNSWEFTIEQGRGADGKRHRKYVSFKGNKGQAQQKLRDLLQAQYNGIPIVTDKITVSQWLSRWMTEYLLPNVRQKTIERYQGIIDLHIVPAIGHVVLAKLTPSEIQGMEGELTAKGMAPKGVELVHTVISGAYKYALRMEVVWRNPAKAVTPPKVTRREVEPPEIARVRQLLGLAEQEDHPLFPAIHLIAYSGLRRGEALGLRHQDINLEAGTISIIQSIGRSLMQGIVVEPTKTNAGRRAVDLDDGTIDVLRAHIGKQLLHRMEREGLYQDNGLLFPGHLGMPVNPMTLTRVFQSYAKRLGMDGTRLHDLRHFHASVMLQNGASLLLVSRRLGHASVATTGDVYGHLMPGAQKEAANVFAQVMEQG